MNIYYLISSLIGLYYTIFIISQIIYKIVDKNKKIMWIKSDITNVLMTIKGQKFYKFYKGDKIVIEYYDGRHAVGKLRKGIISRKVYAPIDYLCDFNTNKKNYIIRIIIFILIIIVLVFMMLK